MADRKERDSTIDRTFEVMPVGAAILDSGFAVRRANAAFVRLIGSADSQGGRPQRLACLARQGGGTEAGWSEAPFGRTNGTVIRLRFRLVPLSEPATPAATWLLLVEEAADPGERVAALEARLIEARTRFLSGAGHDLRQPLNALSLFLGVLRATKTHDRAVDIAGRMQGTLETVVALFNGIHTLAKLETGAVPVQSGRVEAERVIESLLTQFEDAAAAKGLAFRAIPSAALLDTDQDILLVALRAFVANAITHTSRGGVLIGCRRRSAAVRIDVIDTGPGIPANEMAILFEDFQRGRNSGQNSGSYGIGLGTAARAARLLDLPLDVDSRIGHGSRFSIFVPRADP